VKTIAAGRDNLHIVSCHMWSY